MATTRAMSAAEHRFAENVAFLSLLSPALSSPSDNPIPSTAVTDGRGLTRVLSFARECCLARGLAFLAAISDDPNHVVAVCLEELPRRKGLAVRVAINRAQVTSGQGTLDTIRQGLQGVFHQLSQVGSGQKSESDVLDAVVRLCRRRILQRLRLNRVPPKGWKKLKPRGTFGRNLESITNAVAKRMAQRTVARRDYPAAESFVRQSNQIQAILSQLEDCPDADLDHRLGLLISTASRLNSDVNLANLLGNMPRGVVEATTRDSVVGLLQKLAQYRDFPRYLFQAAKNLNMFRHVEVHAVSLPPECFARAAPLPDQYSLEACLARCQLTEADIPDRLCQNLGISHAALAARDNTTQTEPKIHAEMQILAHYELNPAQLPPRVISSNKDACYLCNEAVRIDGRFYIPRSHGRLYPGWRLPSLPSSRRLQDQLNHGLETRLGSLCREVLRSGRRPVAAHPNESTVFPPSTSMSTLASLRTPRSATPVGAGGPNTPDLTPALVPALETSEETAFETSETTSEPPRETAALERDKAVRDDSGYASMPSPGGEDDPDPGEASPRPCLQSNGSCVDLGAAPAGESREEAVSPFPSSSSSSGGLSTQSAALTNIKSRDKGKEPALEAPSVSKQGPDRPYLQSNISCVDFAAQAGDRQGEEEAISPFPSSNSISEAPSTRSAAPTSKTGRGREPTGEATAQRRPATWLELRRGVAVRCRVADYTSFRLGPLTVVPELVGRGGAGCRMRIEWLEDARGGGGVPATHTDVWALSTAVERHVPGRFWLRHGDVVVRMEIVG